MQSLTLEEPAAMKKDLKNDPLSDENCLGSYKIFENTELQVACLLLEISNRPILLRLNLAHSQLGIKSAGRTDSRNNLQRGKSQESSSNQQNNLNLH